MFRNMTGRDIRLAALLDGGFGDARFVYRITSPHMQFDNNGFDEVRIAGAGHLSRAPIAIPMLATATRVTGVGDMAADILGHPRLEGTLQLTGARLTGTGLVFTSDKARGLVDGDGNLATGGWVVLARGGMQNYLDPGLRRGRRAHPAQDRAGAGRARDDDHRHRAGLGAAARQPLPCLGLGRAAAGRDQSHARAGPDRPFQQFAGDLAQDLVRRHRPRGARRHLFLQRQCRGMPITGPRGSASKGGSSGRALPCGSIVRSTHSAWPMSC